MKSFAKRLGFLLMFTYMISYITRKNYSAIILAMQSATAFTEDELSIALTGLFITYGVGQVISGWFGDKIQPRYLVTAGLATSSAVNILLPFFDNNLVIIIALWCVNGFAQAFMWPPMVRLMATLLSEEEYKHASVITSYGSSLGTMAVYFLSFVMLRLIPDSYGWKSMFWLSAACAIVMIPVWYNSCPLIKEEPKPAVTEKKSHGGAMKYILTPFMIVIMLAIVLQGSLRDGVETWMPSFIKSGFDLGEDVSILTGVLIPIFSIVTFKVTAYIYETKLKNPMTCSGVIFGVGALAAAALVVMNFIGSNVIVSIVSTALLTACMHGVNLILICMIPRYFNGTGHVSLISGVLNACTYIGSAISTYGMALVTKYKGWDATVMMWFVIAALGTFLCLICIKSFKKRFN